MDVYLVTWNNKLLPINGNEAIYASLDAALAFAQSMNEKDSQHDYDVEEWELK